MEFKSKIVGKRDNNVVILVLKLHIANLSQLLAYIYVMFHNAFVTYYLSLDKQNKLTVTEDLQDTDFNFTHSHFKYAKTD